MSIVRVIKRTTREELKNPLDHLSSYKKILILPTEEGPPMAFLPLIHNS